ncbi:uncharacterized protein EV154DRAFT_551577 [Mucor mucedo]|uniref:uncharacterized protein n=1 Tax=Mucor mucedo TaxID=29922 RepID=UPI00221EF661|nr:uncharacterized protein EV154DRAFT_551577 [Mucor mucedo]KAI7891408.1 hypothetical protein EV154DRAFT_551577 [Mucor mucedo]
MEEVYDYSRHRYCINIDLGYDMITSIAVTINRPLENDERYKKNYRTSILYDTTARNIIARGNKADEANENPEGLQEGVIYVRNTISALADIYLKSKQQSFDTTALYALLYEEAIDLLQKILDHCKQELNSVNMDFYYSLNLPTSWDYEIREELFLPLFVKAGLLHENDGPGRLVFFTMLELNFQCMQMNSTYHKARNIKYGDQRVICTIDYQGAYSVDFKLVSVQYPAFKLERRTLVPQLLKQAHFVIPFGLKELRLSLIACVEKHCDTTLSSESIDDLLEKLSQQFDGFRYFDMQDEFLDDQPLPDLKSRWANRLITLEDILEHFSGQAEKIFRSEVDKFLVGRSNTVPRPLDIYYTSRIPETFFAMGLISLFDCWSKKYFRELKESYISAERGADYPIFEPFDYNYRRYGTKRLINYRMEEFNVRRNSVILPNETTMEEPKSFLKPIIFINIDVSPTRIQTTFTYLDKGRQVGQRQNFECNMQPLNYFIKQSEIYQRPVLHISNRLKLGLEKIFGDYLQLYSSYKRNVKKRIPVSPASKLLGRAFQNTRKRNTLSIDERIKSKENRLKRIRKLFVSLDPDLFKELMTNLEMDNLFASKDEFPASDSESFATCHPGYMYFFMITYLHCLNTQIEEKLKSNVGLNWGTNNIWYGVSIDKSILDTVFGSIKNLEKSFFASGILGKDDELRKAKFCTRGEEILPAIQHKYQHLDFSLKSYFVVAQISSKHIQLSLHQVVKLASPGEDPASMIIQDEIIHIDDVYDTLCKSIMKSIQVNCQVDYCTAHKNGEDVQYDFQSFEIYSNVYRNLKPCVVELFEKNKSNLDMDSKIQLNINTKCDCSISISLPDIIEVGLMSVIESITTDILASLDNKRLFGNFIPKYIFVFGDPFNLGQGSKIYIAYTMLMQKSIDDGVYMKEKDTKTFVLRESIFQLLETVLSGKKPYMFERFVTGTLCQVSSKTYGMRITADYKPIPFTRINGDGVIKNTITEVGSYLVFIQKGKPVPTRGLIIQINEPYYIRLTILQLESSTSTVPDKYTLLHGDTPGVIYDIYSIRLTDISINTFVVEYEQISNNLSIKLSGGCMGDIYDYIDRPYYLTENILEPLTLAYI